MAKKGKIQRKVVSEYLIYLVDLEAKQIASKNVQRVSERTKELTENDSFSHNSFWKLKKTLNMKTRCPLQRVKVNGNTTCKPHEIKEAVTKEFKHRLRNREAHLGWEDYVKTTNELMSLLMEQNTDPGPPFTMKELQDAIKKTKNGKSPGPDGIPGEIFKNAGHGVLKPLLHIFNTIKETKRIPDMWYEVLIVLVFKNKGSHDELVNYRGIFLTLTVTKIFERMLQTRMLPSISKTSYFQSGSRPGRSVADNLFLLRSAIDHSRYLKRPLYLTTYDYEQAFDGLWLQDSILTLHRLGVESYILQLIYNLNKRANVKVRTPYGMTEEAEIQELVKQGGVLGPILCSSSTAEYCETNKGCQIGTSVVASLAHVDDIADISMNCDDAEAAHQHAISFSNRKKLTLSVKKCESMVIFKKDADRVPSLFIGNTQIKGANVITYLGDIFNNKGTNKEMIADRVGRGIKCHISMEAFIRETSFGIYTISIYILLHNMIFVASVLFNCQVWTNVSKSDMELLGSIQVKVLRKILNARRMTSTSFLFLELGILPLKYEVHIRQLTFLHHIVNLDERDPVKLVWRSLSMLPEYRNWWSETKDLMDRYKIELEEEEIVSMSEGTYKKLVREKVKNLAFDELKKDVASKTKTRNLDYPVFETQKYLLTLPLKSAQTISRARSKTLDIKHHTPFLFKNMTCRVCRSHDETLDHILNCEQVLEIGDVEACLSSSDVSTLHKMADKINAFYDSIPDDSK